jgi:hypothetical protein
MADSVNPPPTTWAGMVKNNFSSGEITNLRCNTRVCRTPAQERERAQKGHLDVETKLVKVSLTNIRKLFTPTDMFAVFSDEYNWSGELTFYGFEEGIESLLDTGTFEQWRWWHGYNFEKNVIVQFKFQNHLSHYMRKSPGENYVESATRSIRRSGFEITGFYLDPEGEQDFYGHDSRFDDSRYTWSDVLGGFEAL